MRWWWSGASVMRQSEIPHERSLSYLRTVRLTTVDDSADMVMTHGSTTARMTTTTRRGWRKQVDELTTRQWHGTHVDETWPQPTRTDGRCSSAERVSEWQPGGKTATTEQRLRASAAWPASRRCWTSRRASHQTSSCRSVFMRPLAPEILSRRTPAEIQRAGGGTA